MLHKYDKKKFSQKAKFNVESRYRYDPRRPLQCKSFLGNRITILSLLFGILPSLSSLLFRKNQVLQQFCSDVVAFDDRYCVSRVYEHSRYDAFLNYTAQSTIEFKKAFFPLSVWLLRNCQRIANSDKNNNGGSKFAT